MAGLLLQYLDLGSGQAYADVAGPQNFGLDFCFDFQTGADICLAIAGPPDFVLKTKG